LKSKKLKGYERNLKKWGRRNLDVRKELAAADCECLLEGQTPRGGGGGFERRTRGGELLIWSEQGEGMPLSKSSRKKKGRNRTLLGTEDCPGSGGAIVKAVSLSRGRKKDTGLQVGTPHD